MNGFPLPVQRFSPLKGKNFSPLKNKLLQPSRKPQLIGLPADGRSSLRRALRRTVSFSQFEIHSLGEGFAKKRRVFGWDGKNRSLGEGFAINSGRNRSANRIAGQTSSLCETPLRRLSTTSSSGENGDGPKADSDGYSLLQESSASSAIASESAS